MPLSSIDKAHTPAKPRDRAEPHPAERTDRGGPFRANRLILDLGPIRAQFQSVWDELGPRLVDLSERILAVEIAGTGHFARHGESFVFEIDARLSPRQQQAWAEHVARNMLALIYGETVPAGIKASDLISWRPPVSGEEAGPKKRNRIRRFFARLFAFGRRRKRKRSKSAKAAHPAPVQPSPSSGDAPAAGSKPQSGGSPGQNDHAAGPASNTRGSNATGTPAPKTGSPNTSRAPAANGPGGHERLVRYKQENRSLEASIEAATEQRERAAESLVQFVFPPHDLDFVFRPVWNSRTNLLSTYFCVPVCMRGGELCANEKVLPKSPRPGDLSMLDHLMLGSIQSKAEYLVSTKVPPILAIPVHLDTLTNPDHQFEYFESLDRISDRARRQILFEIVDIANFALQSRMFELMRRLAPFCRGVIGRAPITDTNFDFWKQVGLVAIGTDLSTDPRTEADMINDLQLFAGRGKTCKLHTYVRGLGTMSLAAAAVGAGFEYIESTAIDHDPTNDGFGITRFELSHLYEGILNR